VTANRAIVRWRRIEPDAKLLLLTRGKECVTVTQPSCIAVVFLRDQEVRELSRWCEFREAVITFVISVRVSDRRIILAGLAVEEQHVRTGNKLFLFLKHSPDLSLNLPELRRRIRREYLDVNLLLLARAKMEILDALPQPAVELLLRHNDIRQVATGWELRETVPAVIVGMSLSNGRIILSGLTVKQENKCVRHVLVVALDHAPDDAVHVAELWRWF